jgi:hypothetical protein
MNDVAHSYYSALTAMNGGAMNGFDLIDGANINGNMLAYTEMTEAEIPNYYHYARWQTTCSPPLRPTAFRIISTPSRRPPGEFLVFP